MRQISCQTPKVYLRLLSEYDPKHNRAYKARFKMEENYKIYNKLYKYKVKDVLNCLKSIGTGKATVTIQKRNWKVTKEIIYVDPSYFLENDQAKLLLLSATCPPSLLKKALNIEEVLFFNKK